MSNRAQHPTFMSPLTEVVARSTDRVMTTQLRVIGNKIAPTNLEDGAFRGQGRLRDSSQNLSPRPMVALIAGLRNGDCMSPLLKRSDYGLFRVDGFRSKGFFVVCRLSSNKGREHDIHMQSSAQAGQSYSGASDATPAGDEKSISVAGQRNRADDRPETTQAPAASARPRPAYRGSQQRRLPRE